MFYAWQLGPSCDPSLAIDRAGMNGALTSLGGRLRGAGAGAAPSLELASIGPALGLEMHLGAVGTRAEYFCVVICIDLCSISNVSLSSNSHSRAEV